MSRWNRVLQVGTFVLVLGAIVLLATNIKFSAGASLEAAPPIYYVDAAVDASGDGSSWEEAFKTINEATAKPLEPGSILWVRPGTYNERVVLKQSGAQVVTMTTGVQIQGQDQVVFPAGADLSGIDLIAHPGEYYLYLARSWVGNSGVYQIVGVNPVSRTATVSGANFRPETGTPNDDTRLSAAVGRPVQLRNADPQNGYVTLDGTSLSGYTMLYIGDGWNDPCGANNPVSFITVDGVYVTNRPGGVHIQDASYVVFANGGASHITDAPGIYVNGTQTHPARYNFLINNEIYDTSDEGIYIGAGWQGEACNHTQFTHVLGNDISHSANAWLENAIEVKEHHNRGSVIFGNTIHNFTLDMFWNGAIHLQPGANDTLIYGNVMRDITPNYAEDPLFIIGVDAWGDADEIGANAPTRNVYIFNNLIYNTVEITRTIYAIGARGDHTENVHIYHNTIHNINGGLYLHYDEGDGSDNDVHFKNNIFDIPAGFPLITDEDWVLTGTFHLSHNFFSRTPEHYTDATHWTGDPGFVNAPANLRLKADSAARDKAIALTPPLIYDFDFILRDNQPDLGAFEYISHIFLPLVFKSAP